MSPLKLITALMLLTSCKVSINSSATKISGGSPIKDFSAVVPLLVIKRDNQGKILRYRSGPAKGEVKIGNCTGTLVKPSGDYTGNTLMLLTAAHCLGSDYDTVIIADRRVLTEQTKITGEIPNSTNSGQSFSNWIDQELDAKLGKVEHKLRKSKNYKMEEFLTTKLMLKEAQNDYASVLIQEEQYSDFGDTFANWKKSAYEIGWDVDITKVEEKDIYAIGAGVNQKNSDVGFMRGGNTNIKITTNTSKTIITDPINSCSVSTRTCGGDSGGPLLYKDKGKYKVLGVLHGGVNDSNSIYSNLAGGRFLAKGSKKQAIENLFDTLLCPK